MGCDATRIAPSFSGCLVQGHSETPATGAQLLLPAAFEIQRAINTPAGMIHYGVTKTAQLAVSRGLAESCAGTAVTVNVVLPGPTHSAGVRNL
jgi:NAD(P)-dependent dehydrogenase (short-subunit alcohol dehydrogenase family)